MELFDRIPRTHIGPAALSEDTFSFLNRSARPEFESVCQWLEDAFSRYPRTECAEQKKKFKTQFDSAFFELLIHELLIRLDCKVEVHPTLIGTKAKPDFLARFPSGDEVIVEAVLATDTTDEKRAQNARLYALCDSINSKLQSPNFFICFGNITNPDLVPSFTKLRNFIQRQLSHLDPDMVEQAVRLGSVLPRWTYRGENGFELEITAIPKTPGTRGLSDIQPIGSLPPEVRWGGGSAALRNSLKGKMTKYGKSDIPFVVAVNALSSWGTSREDALEALIRPSEERSMSETLWNHTKNTRVSGVIVARAFPWNVLGTTLCFYHNPFAKRPCFYPWRIPQMIMKGSTPEWIEGCDSTELFK